MRRLSQSLSAGLQKRFRGRRAELFRRCLRPSPEDTILDLGGGYGEYFATVVPFRRNVWIADIDERILQRASRHGFQTALIPTNGTLPFPDQHFDIVHCNSVIEHVIVAEHRALLASEIRRVARNWFIQTPNRWFFLEPHTCMPFAQYLPRSCRRVFLQRICRLWGGDALGWKLLDTRELLALFPGGTLVRERFLHLTKSLVVMGGDRIGWATQPCPAVEREFPLPVSR